MKKIFSVTMMLCISMCCMFAQSEVIKFLGIPVDGTKEEMIQKLKTKGFQESHATDLEGRFNGEYVYLDVITNNNNKVYCIALADKSYRSAEEIRVRFNKLCTQFENNGKYMSLSEEDSNHKISENEDISYEMRINHKDYSAHYIYSITNDDIASKIEKTAKTLYGKNYSEITDESEKEKINKKVAEDLVNDRIDNRVFFTINEIDYRQYIIVMFYMNYLNQANGEDL